RSLSHAAPPHPRDLPSFPTRRSSDLADVIVRLITDEPTPPRKLDRRIPRDLETICLKAMAKPPERRYASVTAFLEDIRRFEAGEDRKSTRLNSSHLVISYAVFCLKKK